MHNRTLTIMATAGLLAAALGLAPGCSPPPAPQGDDSNSGAGSAQPRSSASLPSGPNPMVPGLVGDEALQAELDAVLASKGPGYVPRTEHLDGEGRPKFTNRLITQTSPYLLQHAHNPVNWYPWGDEVFARAQREDKLVLLSIGYSTCHWCHVMERESFENEALAAYLNSRFLAIKVDREQRPDLDEVYMRAVQLLSNGRGGWPMTVILTPERLPVFGGTYFPLEDHNGRPGFRSLLESIDATYTADPAEIVERARSLSANMAELPGGAAPGRLPTVALLDRAVAAVGKGYDPVHGGFGGAPKFPRPATLELLLRHAHRRGDPQSLAWARGTLDGIIAGGIRDHVGGGFHRYATDARWLVPHFEKMLYDNAQLVVVLLELYQVSGDPRYAEVARETLDYLDREMRAPTGGFYSATDADSLDAETGETHEGLFFSWTEAELGERLGPEQLAAVRAYYATSARGNFEGRNILSTPRPLTEVASELGLEPEALAATLAEARRLLYAARSERPAPLRDDKILSAWNGLAISAFARAAWVLDEPRYLDRAAAAGEFLATRHVDGEGRLLRSSLGEELGGRGFLDDYAFVIQADLDLFEASGELKWLDRALALQAGLDAHHLDPAVGGYFTTADDGEVLLARNKPSYDGAEPSGNSVAALNLLRLHQLGGQPGHRERAIALLEGFAGTASRGPSGVPKLLCALDFALDRPLQIFVVTATGQPAPAELLAVLRRSYVPNRVLAIVAEDRVPEFAKRIPALEHKRALGGQATVYVCIDTACRAPTSDPDQLRAQLRGDLAPD